MAYFSNQVDEPEQLIPPPVPVAQTPTSTVFVMTQTPAVMTDPVGTLSETALIGHSTYATSWTSPNPGSTRRFKHGQAKKLRRQMPFRTMRMHSAGDKNIIPIYRPEDKTTDLVPSMPKEIDIDEQVTATQVSVAAPKL